MPKLQGFEFWSRTLGGARHVVAPMVDQSELAWRLLSRRHGAQLCYTPMLHAQVFVRDANYRKENLYCEVCPEDRPLIVQFCANDPEVFVQAALLAQDYCDAIDLNLGCPQMIAKRGHYGAFLQEEWDLLQRMILLAHEKLAVPVTCKIRVFPEIDKTVRYAQMLEKAGCQLLTVHGRTKEQKGPLSGTASWEHIKAVRKAVAIPVFANGNIQCLRDVERCLQDTGVQGVMSAEGNLHNPALFEGRSPAVWELAEEYLDIVRQHPCPLSCVRAHLFKLWHHTLQVHQQLREELAKVKTLEGVVAVNQELKLRCQEDISRQKEGEKPSGGLPFFHWICQPYLRPGPGEGSKENGGARSKRALEEEEGGADVLSKNKQKKQLRNPHKTFDPSLKPKYAKCDQCGNPKGNRCVFSLCRGCCKKSAFREAADCPGSLPLLSAEGRAGLPSANARSPEMLHWGAGAQAGPAPSLQRVCSKANNKCASLKGCREPDGASRPCACETSRREAGRAEPLPWETPKGGGVGWPQPPPGRLARIMGGEP
ncbi:tRNA-dihydrouridine(16/17) synthase [NAD(P)(+)]-like isoform X2 [Lutra lutra]|uniref:tRNA-dihydrouridine(16/17) synthase [NAD(P)(+)]-like isoform X2 n=1 Tax=Lutra lutra TaxID=9657 RepID=UPI001FD17CDF|nr:tRNA-dihydrouridine(16/17) synthase [NAD(P)(+)]-like isoform X2 [Lutra lutra]